ncbi:MAG TPA: hypothetical protein VFU02_24755 [Polyangiaceae bacterium]|nr:hypothetical protein [Polyangiaceae bacterium]
MRTFKSFVFLSALVSAVPAYGQEEPAAEAPAEAEEAAPEPAAPAAETPADPNVTAAATAEAAPVATAPAAPAAGPQAATSRPSPVSRGGEDTSGKEWTFDYHGYLRAPFSVGIGARQNRYCLNTSGGGAAPVNTDGSTRDCDPNTEVPTAEGQSGTTFHQPLVPDGQYLSWQYSGHQKGSWAEMFFSMGNDVVSGTLAIQGFQFTDASWKNNTAQFGIGQGWVEFNSDLGYENIRFNAKAGSFWSRYGMAGKYDAGEYDTYLFGRTHTMGAASRVEVGLDDEYTLGIEGGLGGRRPDPSIFNRARFTMLAHAHADINWVDEVQFSGHFLHSFSQTEQGIMVEGAAQDSTALRPNGAPLLYAEKTVDDTTPDGKLSVWGLDARLDLDMAGYLYAGFSQIRAKTAFTVAPAIEVLHSFGGGEFTGGVIDNYLESPFCRNHGYGDVAPGLPQNLSGTCSNGTGTVNTLLAQYEIRLANFGLFEGGQDLKMKFFGIMNFISVDDRASFEANPAYDGANADLIDEHSQDGTRKLKFGGDFEYFALPWLSAGLRADRLQPHSKVPEQSFTVVSPRITFRSDFVTREAVTLQYTRYIYEQRECEVGNPADDPFYTATPPNSSFNDPTTGGLPGRVFCVQPPNNPTLPDGWGAHGNNGESTERGAPSTRPDINTVSITATMWW